MSILIPGMKMPRKGEMLVIFPDGTSYVCFNGMRERLAQTKAVPVPQHGRLGDLDKISNLLKDRIAENDKWILEFCAHGDSKSVNELYDENAILERVISLLKYDSRTIIPAEEE